MSVGSIAASAAETIAWTAGGAGLGAVTAAFFGVPVNVLLKADGVGSGEPFEHGPDVALWSVPVGIGAGLVAAAAARTPQAGLAAGMLAGGVATVAVGANRLGY